MSTFTVSTESRGFLLGTVIATASGLALTITNAVYYSQARNNCNSISTTTANVMMWLNIILAVIFGIILIWAIYRLVVHPDLRKELRNKTSRYIAKQKTKAKQGTSQYLSQRPDYTFKTQPSAKQSVPLNETVSTRGTKQTSPTVASNVINPSTATNPDASAAL